MRACWLGRGPGSPCPGAMSRSSRTFRATLGGDHVALPCNLSDGAAVDQLVPRAVEALGGKLDILVNNAGVTRDNLLMRMKDEEFEEVIRVNLEAAFRLMRAAARPMMKARFGRIISVTSVVGGHRQPGAGELRRVQGGLDRDDKSRGAGAGEPRDHRQRDRSWLHDVGDDRRAQRASARGHPLAHSNRPDGQRRRHRRGRACTSPAARRATSPGRPCT